MKGTCLFSDAISFHWFDAAEHNLRYHMLTWQNPKKRQEKNYSSIRINLFDFMQVRKLLHEFLSYKSFYKNTPIMNTFT